MKNSSFTGVCFYKSANGLYADLEFSDLVSCVFRVFKFQLLKWKNGLTHNY